METVEIERWRIEAIQRTMEKIRKIAEEIDERVRSIDIQLIQIRSNRASEETRHQALDTLNFDVWQLKRLMERPKEEWIL
jgi:RPA family protein